MLRQKDKTICWPASQPKIHMQIAISINCISEKQLNFLNQSNNKDPNSE